MKSSASNGPTWLVTGGAGYIGRHVVRTMHARGHRVVVLDDLSSGDRATLPVGVPFVLGSVGDLDTLRRVLTGHGVTGILHLAARKSVAESVADPVACYRTNVGGTLALAEALSDAGVRHVVHSSSAAVYGAIPDGAVQEGAATSPINPYGATKLTAEWILDAVASATGAAHVSLRYFNVAGTAEPQLRDRFGTSLIPLVLDALRRGEAPVVLGVDHSTADGSCVRDFVHVSDVADAHLRVVETLEAGGGSAVYNIGTGQGTSVLEVLAVIRRVTGLEFRPEILCRREGDPASAVACVARARADLGWRARHGVEQMVRSEWAARLAAAPQPVRALTSLA